MIRLFQWCGTLGRSPAEIVEPALSAYLPLVSEGHCPFCLMAGDDSRLGHTTRTVGIPGEPFFRAWAVCPRGGYWLVRQDVTVPRLPHTISDPGPAWVDVEVPF